VKPPSTQWQETIEPGEDDRFDGFAKQLVAMQKKKSAKYGNGRALHRKQVTGLDASLEVFGELPETARHGLFAKPATYEARVRLSNGSMERQADSRGDIRGFGIKILGVSGVNALDGGECRSQEFALIQRAAFGFARVEPFVGLVLAAAEGPLALVKHLVKQHGLFGALKLMKQLAIAQGAPFSGFASEPFYSAAPIACGPYAVRVRIAPEATALSSARPLDWANDMRAQLGRGPVRFQFQLQFFVDEQTTPIEDASNAWPESEAPFVTVGRLTLPPQAIGEGQADQLTAAIEATTFDPWNALAAHRPLGNVMRARKAAYFHSEQTRGAK
jgi:hypothetical protein